MKKFITTFMFCLLFSEVCWADQIFVMRNAVNVIFVNTANSVGPAPASLTKSFGLPSTTGWHEIDVTNFGIPRYATAVYLQGIMIVVNGKDAKDTPVICNEYVYFGDSEWLQDLNPSLQVFRFGLGQTMSVFYGDGVRQPVSSWVPVENGKFKWQWTRSTEGEWPEHCSYGLNFNIQAWTE